MHGVQQSQMARRRERTHEQRQTSLRQRRKALQLRKAALLSELEWTEHELEEVARLIIERIDLDDAA